MEKFIYAFDISMSCTGISIFDLKGNIIKVCSVKTTDKDTHGKRLKIIYDFVLQLKEEYPVEKIIIERGFSRFHISTAVLFRVHGIVNMAFSDVEQIYYPPKTIKAELIGGKATKKQIQDCIIKKYPDIKFENEDESDSVSIGICYFLKTGIISNWK